MNLAPRTLTKSLLVSGTSWGLLRYGLGAPDIPSTFFSLPVDNSVALAASFGLSSLVSESIKNYAIPYLPGSVVNNQMALSALQPIITGGTSLVVHGFGSNLDTDFSDLFKVGVIGALSDVAAQTIEDRMYPSAAQH